MTDRIGVTKMHGARNDFVVVDARRGPAPQWSAFATRVCDRRTGVGADGVIVLQASAVADVKMRVFNADGGEAEMCGNGIRCAARFLDEAGEGDSSAFETAGGIVRTSVVSRNPEYLVRVEMDAPRFADDVAAPGTAAHVVDVGNPHVVIFRDSADDADLAMLATGMQRNPRFPGGINVHVASLEPSGALRVRHWERGVGATMACGTGAVACAVAAVRRGLTASPVEVIVPGGRLIVEWNGDAASLTGPAVRVFDTVLALEPELVG